MQVTKLSPQRKLWYWVLTLNVNLLFQWSHWMDTGKNYYG